MAGDRVVDAAAAARHAGLGDGGSFTSVRAILDQPADRLIALGQAADALLAKGDGQVVLQADEARFGPPVPDPQKILCVGLNYRAHASEASLDEPPVPLVFAKFANVLIGSGSAIELPPAHGEKVDYEGEIAIVIGRPAYRLSEDEALDAVATPTSPASTTPPPTGRGSTDFYAEYFAKEQEFEGPGGDWACVAQVTYTGGEVIARDIANLKAAMEAAGVEEGFLPVVAPAGRRRGGQGGHLPSPGRGRGRGQGARGVLERGQGARGHLRPRRRPARWRRRRGPPRPLAHRAADHQRVQPRVTARVARVLSFRNVSALYVGAGFIVLFSVWIPDVFWTATTWKTLISEQAIVGIAAVGLVVPLAAGAYDLSIGMAVGLGSMIVAWLIGDHGTPMVLAIVASVVAGCAIGVLNGVMVTRFKIDSFIATLAVTSVLTAVVTAISGGEQIIGLPASFSDLASNEILGITLPVYMMIVIALVVWYVLEHTPPGRRTYAAGGNADAARLTGVRTRLIIVVALIAGSAIAAFAGVLVTARSAASAPDVGAGYLLPAFAAAFLGSTQIRNGQFNVWGTILAVYVLAVGVKGLQLAGAPIWLPDLFNGVALAVAVGLARWRR